jgi:hypothetical protein
MLYNYVLDCIKSYCQIKDPNVFVHVVQFFMHILCFICFQYATIICQSIKKCLYAHFCKGYIKGWQSNLYLTYFLYTDGLN